MELRQLRYFVAVAEELHFGRAAARMHITTPTLSQQIKTLERDVGTALLVRGARDIALTPAGAALLRAGRGALRAADDAVHAARSAAGLAAPTLRLGLLNGVPPWLAAHFERLAQLVPGAGIVMVGGPTAQQVRMLEHGEVDLALVRCPVTRPPGVRLVEVATEELGLLMSGAHPLAACESVDPAELAGRELIIFPRELAPGVYDAMLAALAAHGGTVAVSRSEMGHAQLRAALPLRPGALGLSSARGAAPPDLVWRPLRGRPLSTTYAAAWRADGRNPVLHAVVRALTSDVSLPLTDVGQRDVDK